MSYDLTPHAAVLLDLDGTVFKEHHPLPGAVDLIAQFNATVVPPAIRELSERRLGE